LINVLGCRVAAMSQVVVTEKLHKEVTPDGRLAKRFPTELRFLVLQQPKRRLRDAAKSHRPLTSTSHGQRLRQTREQT